jgi:hypothetical protein
MRDMINIEKEEFQEKLKSAAKELGLSLNKYQFSLIYSRRMKGYNTKIVLHRFLKRIEFRFGYKWKEVGWEIQKGAVQALLCRLFKKNKKTMSISLLDSFLSNVHSSFLVQEDFEDDILKESFDRVNEKFFNSSQGISRVRFGKPSRTTLGRYDFDSDEIVISSIFKKAPSELLDYVMYHELLHKKHGYGSSLKRQYHTPSFKQDEQKFPNYKGVEKRLQAFISHN